MINILKINIDYLINYLIYILYLLLSKKTKKLNDILFSINLFEIIFWIRD